jgi:hypothetical protein
MELEVLKKKLSSFKNKRGQIRGVNDDLLLEVLNAWEHWTGSSADFYKNLGSSYNGMASMIGKAKKLKKDGYSTSSPFQEVSIEGITNTNEANPVICDIEVQENNKVIRFRKVDLLVEYLKKAA